MEMPVDISSKSTTSSCNRFSCCFAIFQIALFLRIDEVVVTGSGHHRDFHARLYAGFQVDIIVQRHVRPEIHQLNIGVSAADTVDAPEPLDDAHRVPMNVVVNQVVAILQILTFGDTVGRNQHINLRRVVRKKNRLVLRNRREAGQYVVEGRLRSLWQVVFPSIAPVMTAVSKPYRSLHVFAHMFIQITGGIRECGEDDDLFVSGVDGVRQSYHPAAGTASCSFVSCFGRNVCHHQDQQFKVVRVLLQRCSAMTCNPCLQDQSLTFLPTENRSVF